MKAKSERYKIQTDHQVKTLQSKAKGAQTWKRNYEKLEQTTKRKTEEHSKENQEKDREIRHLTKQVEKYRNQRNSARDTTMKGQHSHHSNAHENTPPSPSDATQQRPKSSSRQRKKRKPLELNTSGDDPRRRDPRMGQNSGGNVGGVLNGLTQQNLNQIQTHETSYAMDILNNGTNGVGEEEIPTVPYRVLEMPRLEIG